MRSRASHCPLRSSDLDATLTQQLDVAQPARSNLVLKKFKPSRWIPLVVLLWSIIQICMGVVKNYGQLVALRFLLGLFECVLARRCVLKATLSCR